MYCIECGKEIKFGIFCEECLTSEQKAIEEAEDRRTLQDMIDGGDLDD